MTDETADNTFDQDLLDVESLLRSLTLDDVGAPEAPPASVWAGIQSELAASGDLTSAATTQPMVVHASRTVASLDAHRERRNGRYRFLAAAAAAVVVVAGAVAVVATRGGDDAQVVATAELTWDPTSFDPMGEGGSAIAELVQADGGFEIVLRDASLPVALQEDADLELWLIEKRGDGSLDPQPVRKLEGTEGGVFRVPTGLDPTTHNIVDISIEPRDGDEAHSGRSILRGPLADT